MSGGAREPKRVVVIGGAGYLGSVLTGQLLDAGYEVDVFDALLFGDESLRDYRAWPRFRLVVGDVCHLEQVTALLEGAYAVVLLAALVGEPACNLAPKRAVDVNLSAPIAIALACRYYQVPRFLFASTDSAYGIQEGVMTETSPMNPISLYARLKMQAEREILALAGDGFSPTILRMATIYGLSPRMRFDLIINLLTLHAVVRNEITIYGGEQWRPLVHVTDAARAYVMCLDAPLHAVSREVFNVGSNAQNYQIGQLGELIRSVFPEVKIKMIPQSPDLRDYYVSFDKISRVLGYRVHYSVIDGIQEICAALRSDKFTDFADSRYYNAPQPQVTMQVRGCKDFS